MLEFIEKKGNYFCKSAKRAFAALQECEKKGGKLSGAKQNDYLAFHLCGLWQFMQLTPLFQYSACLPEAASFL